MSNQRIRTLSIVGLLVVTLGVAPMLSAGQVETRAADLALEQPAYIQGGVTTTSANGTGLYKVSGSPIEIVPTNLGNGTVVGYGVSSGSGELAYDKRFDSYELQPEATGTYTVYWIVETPVAVTQGNSTEVETRQYRYEANIRVTGGLDMTHQPAGALAGVREDAQKWQEFNQTIQPLGQRGMLVQLGLADPPSTAQLIQGMINAWILAHDPLGALAGTFGTIHILLITSLGGALFVIIYGGYHSLVVAFLYRKLNIHNRNEAAEGELAARLQELDERDRVRIMDNLDHSEIYQDEHVAQGMADIGDTPRESLLAYRGKTSERAITANRLQAMGLAEGEDWVGIIQRTLADGGEPEGDIQAAQVKPAADVGPDAETVALAEVDPDGEFMDALDWAAEPIREFDYANAEFDRDALATPVEPFEDLTTMLETLEMDRRHFSDEAAAAEYFRELLQEVRDHGYCDAEGRPDTLRHFLNEHLHSMRVLRDRYDIPLEYDIDLVERAILDHDTRERARETLSNVREGKYA